MLEAFVVYIWLRYDSPEMQARYPQPTKVYTNSLTQCRKIADAWNRVNRRAICYRTNPNR